MNSQQPKLKGILFDLDDTLIDWSGFTGDWRAMEHRHLANVYHFLAEKGRPLDASLEEFEEEYVIRTREAWANGRATLRAPHVTQILEGSLAYFGYEADELVSIAACMDVYDWGAVPGVEVFPDVPPMLQKFLDRGLSIGIITNASQPMSIRDNELKAFGLLPYFQDDAIRLAAADVGYLKPHPEIFRYTLDKMGAQPEEAIYIGDNPVADIAGAQGAGMRAVLRRKEGVPPLISGLIVPDGIIESLYDLPDLLNEWYPGW
ncbi:HAD family hydrolase [Phototrophicus methaneseepsis]|uniref:HAD family hydrolase n=1 Tax=Phototrophicus methaneseepsis TaxID=2710758 RepID=A0A7S8EAX1_9CHLR|nr:HAD family hydrolase [Phototrophicus methaneseepsis]QPC83586.1 HAD family hydrolase [Phototrophicus methaneseepsis]